MTVSSKTVGELGSDGKANEKITADKRREGEQAKAAGDWPEPKGRQMGYRAATSRYTD